MRLRLALSPWWVQGLVYGVFFGAAMTVVYRVQAGSWVVAAASGAGSGLMFGLAMGLMMSRLNRRMLAGLEDLPLTQLRTVARAASRGPAPVDPRLREAAVTLLQRRRDHMLRTRNSTVATFAAVVVLYVVLALSSTRWWWLGAVMFLAFLVATLRAPARLNRRLATLQPDPQPASDSSAG